MSSQPVCLSRVKSYRKGLKPRAGASWSGVVPVYLGHRLEGWPHTLPPSCAYTPAKDWSRAAGSRLLQAMSCIMPGLTASKTKFQDLAGATFSRIFDSSLGPGLAWAQPSKQQPTINVAWCCSGEAGVKVKRGNNAGLTNNLRIRGNTL